MKTFCYFLLIFTIAFFFPDFFQRPLLDTNLFECTADDGSDGKGKHNNRKFESNVELAFHDAPVSFGGPLESLEFSLVHSFGRVDNSVELVPGIYVGGSEALANEVLNNQFQTDQALFCKGHAAWVPGRLEHEISKGVWYTAATSPDLIFRYATSNVSNRSYDSTDLWGDILSIMGDKYANKAQAYARQGDVRAMP
jgi:putative transcriptional regulator